MLHSSSSLLLLLTKNGTEHPVAFRSVIRPPNTFHVVVDCIDTVDPVLHHGRSQSYHRVCGQSAVRLSVYQQRVSEADQLQSPKRRSGYDRHGTEDGQFFEEFRPCGRCTATHTSGVKDARSGFGPVTVSY